MNNQNKKITIKRLADLDTMTARNILTGVGAGVTTFLLITVAVIELLPFEFSAILGLPVGFLAGLAVLVGFWSIRKDLDPGISRAVSAYGTFGLAVLVLFLLDYVNIGIGERSVGTVIGVGVVAGAVVYVILWSVDRGRSGSADTPRS